MEWEEFTGFIIDAGMSTNSASGVDVIEEYVAAPCADRSRHDRAVERVEYLKPIDQVRRVSASGGRSASLCLVDHLLKSYGCIFFALYYNCVSDCLSVYTFFDASSVDLVGERRRTLSRLQRQDGRTAARRARTHQGVAVGRARARSVRGRSSWQIVV